jgi:hypothetical protein
MDAAFQQQTKEKDMTSLNQKGPVYKQKSHGIEVAVWKRVNDDDKAFFSISATRSYRDSDGNWKTTSSFNLEDKDLLIDYLVRAFRFRFHRI